ncbi:MFS transporter [Kocuria sp. TGY1127_2]|uniref:MFS transporter n=1 Tax=Kocuria sp. TGY1127_2 TaxID=2711328 RepID=UPI0015B99CA4|nr:MFS transporter [Kocuria sp. TGY1127_2]
MTTKAKHPTEGVGPDSAWRVHGAMYLLLTAFLGRLPQAMGALALVRFVRDGGGSYNLAGVVTAVFILGGAVGQPYWGRLVDRHGARIVVSITSLCGGLGLCLVTFLGPAHPVLVTVAATVAGVATPPLESCLRSTWTAIMRPGKQLNSAFSLDVAAQQFLFVLGPILNVVSLAVLGSSGNVLLMAFLTVAGSIAFALFPVMRKPLDRLDQEVHKKPLAYSALRRIVAVQFLIGVPVGALPVIVNTFGELRHESAVSGVLLGINGLGGFAGSLWIGRWKFKWPIVTTLRWTVFGFGCAFILLFSPQLPLVSYAAILILAGIGFPMALAQIFHLTERSVPRKVLNEANAWAVSGVGSGIAAGTWGCGLALDAMGPVVGTSIAVITCACVAWSSLVIMPRHSTRNGRF